MDETRKKDLMEKLEAVKELKEQYYLGSCAAYVLIKEAKESLDLEKRLKEDISKQGLHAKFSPSYLELEEINECLNEIVNSSISGSIEREHKNLTGNYLPSKIRYKYVDLNMESMDLFLKQFALNRAKIAQDSNNPKIEAFVQTLENYLPDLFGQYSKLFKENNIPGQVLPKAIVRSKEKIIEKLQLLRDGIYKGVAEADRLASIGIDGRVNCDKIYDRLENEQILYKDGMQKIYLVRFIAENNIKNYCEFLEVVQMVINDSALDNPKQRKEKEYVKLISNRHKNWIKKFLTN